MNRPTASRHPALQAITETVFEPRPKRRRLRRMSILLAWLVAVVIHATVWVAAERTEPSLEEWSARMALLVHEDLTRELPIDLGPRVEQEVEPPPEILEPRKPAKTPEPPAQKGEPRAERAAKPPPRSVATSSKPSDQKPAGAAEVVAKSTNEPLDFSEEVFATGGASAFVGGATAAGGTRTEPEPSGATRGPGDNGEGGASLARPVRLPAGSWDCAWPERALAEDIYEQFVVLRVSVDRRGKVQSVEIQDNPGKGFGAAAAACAKATRFAPATDARGRPTAGTSPPIRVRFVR